MSWFVIQLGARENYAIARALATKGCLEGMVTDAWHAGDSASRWNPTADKLASRYHADLKDAKVLSFNHRLLAFEALRKLGAKSGWDLIVRRNHWFQKQVVRQLRSILRPEHTVFSYSYTAKKVFELGKEVGCRCILGQIDPGVHEENLVAAEVGRLHGIDTGFVPAPKQYWDNWKHECELADTIMVNSQWSRDALELEGVETAKIKIVPLVYAADDSGTDSFTRTYPQQFSEARPLEILYLGQVIPRKGIQYLLRAAELLTDSPVRFTVVGEPGPWRSPLTALPNVNVVGGVPRGSVDQYYQAADAFLFPTLSDGYGLTQLEAQRWKLPIICSKRCGNVVQDDVNGIELSDVSGESIVNAISRLLDNPSQLERLSRNSANPEFGLADLGERLMEIAGRP
jgi:glycosyltransferase involved in cell wall biosynthesis